MRIVYFVALLLSLSACEWQVKSKADSPDGLSCESPELARAYQKNVQEVLGQVLDLRVKSEYPDLLNPEKIINAFAKSQVLLSSAQSENKANLAKNTIACRAQINITIAEPVFDQARTFSPFIYTPNSYLREINSVANANSINRSNNTLSQTVSYVIEKQDNQVVLKGVNDEEVTRMVQMITTILLPYGVKSTVTVNGTLMSRNDALARILYTAAEEEKSSNVNPVENDEVLKPEIDEELVKKTQEDYQQSQQTIKLIWQKLDETVRASLADEQRNWSDSLNVRCQTVNEQGQNLPKEVAIQACETKHIQERINYLRGFMIE